MNTINLSQFDLATSSNLTPSFSLAIPAQLSIGQTSTNILKLNVVNVVMDKIAAQALLNLKEKYKTNTLVIKSPALPPAK